MKPLLNADKITEMMATIDKLEENNRKLACIIRDKSDKAGDDVDTLERIKNTLDQELQTLRMRISKKLQVWFLKCLIVDLLLRFRWNMLYVFAVCALFRRLMMCLAWPMVLKINGQSNTTSHKYLPNRSMHRLCLHLMTHWSRNPNKKMAIIVINWPLLLTNNVWSPLDSVLFQLYSVQINLLLDNHSIYQNHIKKTTTKVNSDKI